MKSDLLCQYKLKVDFIKSSNQIVSRANPGNLEIIQSKDHKNLFLQSHWSFHYFTKSRVEVALPLPFFCCFVFALY